MRLAYTSILLSAFAVLVSGQPQRASSLDSALRTFWSADTADRRAGAIADVLATGASYDDLAARLKRGRAARTGRVNLPTTDRGAVVDAVVDRVLDNVLEVPTDYDPSRSWPLRVALPGGVGREAPGPNVRRRAADQSHSHPRRACPPSSRLVGIGEVHQQPGRDPLYPAASVAPVVDMFRRGGVPVDFQVYPDAGHDVSWWPDERPRYEAFLAGHRRVAHPERISWETERTDRYNRFRWLVVDRLGAR